MSLTLSLAPTNIFARQDSRSRSLSTLSNDTVHRHSWRIYSTSSPPVTDENDALQLGPSARSLATTSASWPPLRAVQSLQVTRNPFLAQSEVADLQRIGQARPPYHPFVSSNETLYTVPLSDGTQSPSTTHPFPEVAELDAEDPLFSQDLAKPTNTQAFDPSPFKRWLSKLRRSDCHRRSRSHSVGVVSAVRTATMTVAESSILPPKAWLAARFGHHHGSESKHVSRDSTSSTASFLDEPAYLRAVQRRRILEELIDSEENYLGDLKVLTNVYFTLLASVCALSTHAKALVRDNLSALLQLHEGILGELYSAVPHAEYSHAHAKETPVVHLRGHVRWRSADSAILSMKDSRLARKLRHSVDIARPIRRNVPGVTSGTRAAVDVARVFERWMSQFFAYEEYGAKYDVMVRDLAATYKTLGADDAFEKGIEVLSRTLESINNRGEHGQKGVTFGDLVIKPIQRVSKYPLLFENLLKQTPVGDDPEAHAFIEKVLFRLRDVAKEVNRARDDPSTRVLIEKTWLLQDRLVFSEEIVCPPQIRLLGHVLLCGVLYVAYQTKSGVQGQYMLCALFRSYLVLAVPRKGLSLFDIVAMIPILSISLEEPDNGKGLQCHTASFTWKVIFQAEYRLFEIMLSACSPTEEVQWRKSLHERNAIEDLDSTNAAGGRDDFCGSLALDLKPLGTVYGQANTLARRISIHRAATIAAKSFMNQVIIKNTESAEHTTYSSSSSSLPLSRSKSIASAGHLPTLAPRRSERMQLELALTDIWTKELLPYPGMKSESHFKASANHVMRKLSMASIASSFSKRSSAFVSGSQTQRPDSKSRPRTPLEYAFDLGRGRTDSYSPKPPVKRPQNAAPSAAQTAPSTPPVDFHRNPDKFLPPDFELKDPRLKRPQHKKPGARTVTEDGGPRPEVIRRKSLHGLQRSLSSKLPSMREITAPRHPTIAESPARTTQKRQKPEEHEAVAVAVDKENVVGKRLRKLFS